MGILRTAVAVIVRASIGASVGAFGAFVALVAFGAGCGRLGFSTEAAAVDAAPPPPPDTSFLPISPSGTYRLSNPIGYTCASGLVDVGFTKLTFVDTTVNLAVTTDDTGITAQPCKMTGKTAAATGHVDVSCTNPGACNEHYHLTADYTSADQWTGMFEATFDGLCLDCATDTITAAASR